MQVSSTLIATFDDVSVIIIVDIATFDDASVTVPVDIDAPVMVKGDIVKLDDASVNVRSSLCNCRYRDVS